MRKTKNRVLKRISEGQVYGSVIAKIASQYCWVYEDERIQDIADELIEKKNIMALAVLDRNNQVKGIVVRLHLFNLLSRPYGRDVLERKQISKGVEECERFNRNENIFTVANDLLGDINADVISYYLLENSEGRFAGIFSSKDLLLYLSHITTQDIDMARVLQQRLVKERHEEKDKGLEIIGYSRCAKGVGGDFYYVKQVGRDEWLICLCDVSGKGVSASLLNTMLWGMVTMNDWSSGLLKFVRKLNHYIVQSFHMEKYVTGIFAIYDRAKREIRCCDMGHSHIHLFRDQKLVSIKPQKTNFPVGIEHDINPYLYRLPLQSDDVLFLHTDGLMEQLDVNGKEYSMKRVERILKKGNERPLGETSDDLRIDFAGHFEGVQQQDDCSFIFLGIREG